MTEVKHRDYPLDKTYYNEVYTKQGVLRGGTASGKVNRFEGLLTLFNSIFLEEKKKDLKILDIGCGATDFLLYLRNSGYNIRNYVGLDYSDIAIKMMKRLYPAATWILHDITEQLPIKEKFDLILAQELLEHLTQLDMLFILGEIRRLSSDDTLVFTSVPNNELKRGAVSKAHVQNFTEDEFRNLLQTYFSNVKIFSSRALLNEYFTDWLFGLSSDGEINCTLDLLRDVWQESHPVEAEDWNRRNNILEIKPPMKLIGNFIKDVDNRLNHYIDYGTIGTLEQAASRDAAILELRNLDYDIYFKNVKNKHHGMYENYKNAESAKFFVDRFNFDNFIPDFVEINKSKKIRTGRKMKEPYQKTIEDWGGYPKEFKPLDYKNYAVGSQWWGVFVKRLGYIQGSVRTDKKLVAYINLMRYGNFCWYEWILGHGNFLKFGVLPFLHFNLIRYIRKAMPEVDYLMYGEWGYGKGAFKGLQDWKRRLGFNPRKVILRSLDI